MAELGVPELRGGLKTIALMLFLYLAFLPLWLRVAPFYARGVAWTTTRIALPAIRLEGSVQSSPGPAITLAYFLPDARSGGLAKYRQRLLNYVDVPLAAALALGFLPFGWRRRLLAGTVSIAILFLSHVALVAWSAHRIGGVLADGSLAREEVEHRLPQSVQAVRSYGDWSLLLTLLIVGCVVLALRKGEEAGRKVGGGRQG